MTAVAQLDALHALFIDLKTNQKYIHLIEKLNK
jgi:hypothetical protein